MTTRGTGHRRVGLCGPFSSGRLADRLRPLVQEAELRRRLPYLGVTPYAPADADAPDLPDGGLATAPLPEVPAASFLADALVLCGSLSADSEGTASLVELAGCAGVPVLWSAVSVASPSGPDAASSLRTAAERAALLSLRDDGSVARLRETGASADATAVPDPLALLPRLYRPEVLARRLDYLRWAGVLPADAGWSVVEAEDGGKPAPSRGERPLRHPVVHLTARLRRGRPFAFVSAAPDSVPVPLDLGTLLDFVAIVWGARRAVASSDDLLVLAAAYRVPADRAGAGDAAAPGVDETEEESALRRRLAGDTPADPELARRLDTHFDRLCAALAVAEAPSRELPGLGEARLEAERRVRLLRSAQESLGGRAAAARLRLAERLEQDAAERERLRAGAEAARAEAERSESERRGALAALERFRADLDWTRSDAHRRSEELASARAEAARLEDELKRLTTESDASRAASEAATAAARRAEAETKALGTELAAERARSAAEAARLSSELDALRARSAEQAASLGARLRGADWRCSELLVEQAALGERLAASRARVEELERDGRTAEAHSADLSAERGRLSDALDAATRARLAAISELQAMRAEHGAERLRRLELEQARIGWESYGRSLEGELANARFERDAAREAAREQAARDRAAFESAVARADAREAEARRLAGERSALKAEFDRVASLRVLRYTAPLRSLYRRLRRLAGRPEGWR